MQMQRKIERQIRQDKRDIAGLQGILRSNTDDDMLIKNVKQSLTNIQIKTKQHNAKLNEFLRQTELKKDYNRVKIGGIGVTYNVKDDIINKNAKEVKKDVHYIGKIDKNKIGKFKDKIVTEDVILSEERIKHIKEHHPGDYEKYNKHIKAIIEDPDYVLVDNKNIDTLLYMKKLVNERKKYTSCIKIKYYQK